MVKPEPMAGHPPLDVGRYFHEKENNICFWGDEGRFLDQDFSFFLCLLLEFLSEICTHATSIRFYLIKTLFWPSDNIFISIESENLFPLHSSLDLDHIVSPSVEVYSCSE